jgi:hypothetical protein
VEAKIGNDGDNEGLGMKRLEGEGKAKSGSEGREVRREVEGVSGRWVVSWGRGEGARVQKGEGKVKMLKIRLRAVGQRDVRDFGRDNENVVLFEF